MEFTTNIPTKNVGPIKITTSHDTFEVDVPLTTYETPLWASVSRGARISRICEKGISCSVLKDNMTRSVLLEGKNIFEVHEIYNKLKNDKEDFEEVVMSTSRFAKLQDYDIQIVGNLIFIRFSCFTGDASGHNMVTKAADKLIEHILKKYSQLQYVSVSGNYCTDKKVSAVNGILGRGKYVVADILIPEDICTKHLRATPKQIVDLNIKKNLIGSIISGSLKTANAHFANMLLAIYLATGQDAANIIEGSQGITYADLQGKDLYFAVTLPNIIIGTVGNGKHLPFVKERLEQLGCVDSDLAQNSKRLAMIIAATVLCGELSLMGALINQGELMHTHETIERKNIHK